MGRRDADTERGKIGLGLEPWASGAVCFPVLQAPLDELFG